jgi:hypothetical protein
MVVTKPPSGDRLGQGGTWEDMPAPRGKLMATIVPPHGNFEIGRVFGRTFEVIGRNLLLYLALATLLIGLPTLVFELLVPVPMAEPNFRELILSGGLGQWGPLIAIAGFGGAILRYLLQATLVRATIEDLGGRRPGFADCLATGLAVVLPVIGITIVSAVAIFLGFLLFIVPGIMLAVAWCVAIPAKVAEGTGVLASLGRSRTLTKGHRWKILFLLIIAALGLGFVQQVIASGFGAFGIIAAAFASAIASAVAAAVMATLIATMYVELRAAREGTDVNTLAAVFS